MRPEKIAVVAAFLMMLSVASRLVFAAAAPGELGGSA